MVISGVIRPPPEIRAVANRTALYVAKNGRAFESRILKSEKGKTPKFAFLQTTNPFHAYYEDRIQFYEAGGTDEKEEKESAEKKKADKKDGKSDETKATVVKKKASVSAAIDPVAKALLTQRNKIAQIRSTSKEVSIETKEGSETAPAPPPATIEPPPALHFIPIVAPSSLSVAQIETIQLVAQLTALDGKGGAFLQQLTFREWNNAQFAFCHPRSGHFAYFSALVDAYRRVLTLWTTPKGEDATKANSILSGSSALPKDKDDRVDEMANNVQKCLELASYCAEYKRDLAEQRKKQAANGNDTPAVAQVDWHDFVVVETIDFPADQQVVTLPPPPPPPSSVPAATTATASAKADDEMDESDDEATEQIRVVPQYQPKIVSAAAQSSKVMETMIDPITGKSVPIKDMPEHMRIQLLDPKWAQERKKFQDKQKESNLVGADTFASNIAAFAQARGMKSSTDQDVLQESEAAASKKRLEDANRILREQALHPSTKVGPALPGARGGASGPSHAAPAMDPSMQPDSKRPKLDSQLPPPRHASLPPPPPPPPTGAPAIPTTTVLAPPGFEAGKLVPPALPAGEDPFASAATPAMPVVATDPRSNAAPPPTDTTAQPPPPGEPMSEADFVASLAKPEVTLQIRVPNDAAQMAWNFYGQIVSLSAVDVMSKVKSVKQELSRTHLNGMPANKIQLKTTTTNNPTFLKDSMTLAALNIGPNATLELIPKTRGGRK